MMTETILSPSKLEEIKQDAPSLLDLCVQNPDLKITTGSNAEFSKLTDVYQRDVVTHPLAIVQPRNEDDVAITVKYSTTNNIPLTVRGGGHDFWRRSLADDAIVIDIRCLDHVRVADEGQAAYIGGGATLGKVTDDLEMEGRCTAIGSCASVGYVGWATPGGLGLWSGSYGLGCDQIIGARLVNWKGEIFDADEELLWGIRGAGGNFGVIVELKVKIYPAIKGLAGLICFDSKNFSSQHNSFLRAYRKLVSSGVPNAYGAMIGVGNVPTLGRSIVVMFVWNSMDFNEGHNWLAKIKSCGKPVMDTVSEMSTSESLQMLGSLARPYVYQPGGLRSVNLPQMFHDEYIDIATKNLERMPSNPVTAFLYHHVHGLAAEYSRTKSSCFGYRLPHYILEIIGASAQPEDQGECGIWSESFHRDLRNADHIILKGGYMPLNHPSATNISDCFGTGWEKLLTLKQQYDPENRFRFASPQLFPSSV